jgi:hypothetical protein
MANSKKLKKARKLNSWLMPSINEEWAALVLNMEKNSSRGPDLVSDNKYVEVKFCLVNPKDKEKEDKIPRYPTAWTVLNHQNDYPLVFNPIYWALGTYELDRSFSDIKTNNRQEIEDMVVQRELYIVEWSWMNQFPVHRCLGESRNSRWDNSYRYPKRSLVPKVYRTYEVFKGKIHLTKNVPDYLFDLDYV